jgi:hypothetical protein
VLNASTISERLFLEYCDARQYKAEKLPIPKNAGRFPDYKVHTPAGPVIFEIKEFAPNDEDRQFEEEMKTEGHAGFSRSIGKRVRKAIIDAAPQLRQYKDTPFPEVLLLFDNTRGSSTIADYLDTLDVSSGMFGEAVIRFWRHGSAKPVGASDATHGGRRQLTEKERLYIGALGVMRRDRAGEIRIDFYHNPFSNKPVWPRYFLNVADRHYIKSDHPNKAAWDWDEFVGDRKST